MPSDKPERMEWTSMNNDLLESAWGLIANKFGGDWDKATPEWRAAAECWRDKYHKTRPDVPDRPDDPRLSG